MTLYSGTVSFKELAGQHYAVDADNINDAEDLILDMAKDDYPDATDFTVEVIGVD